MTAIALCYLALLLGGNALPRANALEAAASCDTVKLAAVNITAEAAHELFCSGADVLFLDVRTTAEYDAGHIEGAQNMPWQNPLIDNHSQLPNKTIIVYCASGGRSASASAYLSDHGHSDILNMLGGYSAWSQLPDCVYTAVKSANWKLYR